MRFLKWFLGMMVLTIFLAAFGYAAYTEVSAWWGARELLQDFIRVDNLAKQPLEDHGNLCKKENSVGTIKHGKILDNLAGYQLRFTSPHEYLVELVCGTDIKTYIKLADRELKAGTTKISGSGIYETQAGRENQQQYIIGGVKVKRGYRQIFVGLKQGKPVMEYKDITQDLTGEVSPTTSCNGWSGSCCLAGKQVGVGQQLPALDCQNDCYAKCGQPPEITQLYFTRHNEATDMIKSGESVDINYEFTDADGVVTGLIIDFGDGQTQSLEYKLNDKNENLRPRKIVTGTISHVYICLKSQCQYDASIKAFDNDGLTSIDELNTVGVQVWGL